MSGVVSAGSLAEHTHVARAGTVTVNVDGENVTLTEGRHVFFSPADQYAGDADARAQWAAAGFAGLGDSYAS